VTVALKAVPAVTVDGAVTLRWVAASGVTVTILLPVMLAEIVSVAVIIWLGAVKRVTPLVRVFTPLVRVEFTGGSA
jgi:hypothetical protein